MGVFFTVRSAKSSGLAHLQCRIQCTSPKVNFAIAMPLSVDVRNWIGPDRDLRLRKFFRTREGRRVREKLVRIEDEIGYNLKRGRPVTKEMAREVIGSVIYAEQIKRERKELAAAAKTARQASAEAERKRMSFSRYRDMYLKQISDGGRSTYMGRNFAKGTISAVSVALNRLRDFERKNHQEYDFDQIDMVFYRDFTAFLKKIPYSLNTIGKTIKVIKTVMRCAEDDGYHRNRNYMARAFRAPKADSDSIYLTMENLDKINSLEIPEDRKDLGIARDIFMIGVWTAQRFSDYNNIKRSDIHEEIIRDRRIRTIHIVQQKTRKKVVIPCNRSLCGILDRYPGALPGMTGPRFNRCLVELGRMAGLDETVEIRTTRGGVFRTRKHRKYELIRSHTARRTGATLMYLSGMNVYDICKITGHSSIKTLERYIKADELETVRMITESYDYFR